MLGLLAGAQRLTGRRRFAPPSAAGGASRRLRRRGGAPRGFEKQRARLARALGQQVSASGDFMHLSCVHDSEIKVIEKRNIVKNQIHESKGMYRKRGDHDARRGRDRVVNQ